MGSLDFKNIHDWPLPTKALVIAMICAVVFYFAYRLDIASLNDELSTAQGKETELKEQFETVIKKQNDANAELSQFSKIAGMLNQWQNKMINYADLPELLNQILKIGANNQIYFSLFNPGEDVREENYAKVPIKVVGVGSYNQIADFISQVANLPQIVVIGDFIISKENKVDLLGSKLAAIAHAQNMLTLELNLIVYHMPDESAPAPKVPDAKTAPGKTPNKPTPPSTPAPGKTAAILSIR